MTGGTSRGGAATLGVRAPESRSKSQESPWQLRLFSKSLKKRLKLDLLLRMLGSLEGRRCLLITCGDNTGALNYHFRAAGGEWEWAEIEREGIAAMEALLGEAVHHALPEQLPFTEGSFERVVVIDVHEHLDEVSPFNRELRRVLTAGGRVIVTTPNGDPTLPLARVKRWIGMRPAVYGHVVQGFTFDELESMLRQADLRPGERASYSRFFTEAIELLINVLYVKLLSRRDKGTDPGAPIAPNTEQRLRGVEKTYRVYAIAYPLLRLVSSFDRLLPGRGGYAVAVEAGKPRSDG